MCDGDEDCPLSESGLGGEDEENCPQEAEGKKYPLQCTVTLVFPSIQGEACSFFVLYQQVVEVIGGQRKAPGATWKKSRCQVTVADYRKKTNVSICVFVLYFRSTSYF